MAEDLRGISATDILSEIKSYRAQRRKTLEISAFALSQRKTPKGVVDTWVLVAGIAAFKRAVVIVPSAQMLRAWIEQDTFQWLITEEILDEYKEILARCKVRRDLIAHAISLICTAAQLAQPELRVASQKG